MTLLLKPKGRGNWAIVTMTINAPADLFPALRHQAVAVGMEVQFAGLTLRIFEVYP
jgi:hypothetical protein